jgi:hypothetical protein
VGADDAAEAAEAEGASGIEGVARCCVESRPAQARRGEE